MSEFHTDAGAAGRRHSDVGPELRNLAEAVLDRLDPAVRLLAARVQASGPGKCEQMWCPVCALTAVISRSVAPDARTVRMDPTARSTPDSPETPAS